MRGAPQLHLDKLPKVRPAGNGPWDLVGDEAERLRSKASGRHAGQVVAGLCRVPPRLRARPPRARATTDAGRLLAKLTKVGMWRPLAIDSPGKFAAISPEGRRKSERRRDGGVGAGRGSLGGATRGLRGGGRRGRAAAVQVLDVEHDELAALLGDAVQHQVALVVLQDLLHVLQVLLRLLDQLAGPARDTARRVTPPVATGRRGGSPPQTNLYVMNLVSFRRVLKSALAVMYLSLM